MKKIMKTLKTYGQMMRRYALWGMLLLVMLGLAGCDQAEQEAGPADGTPHEGMFEVTFFARGGEALAGAESRAAISGPSDRVQTLVYILYRKDAEGRYAYYKQATVFRPDNYAVVEEHEWPLPAIRETLPDGDYRVVFLGNLDANLFEGQGQEAVLQNYGTYFDEARMVMPAGGPLAFTDRNLFYFASADFNQDAPQVDILLQRIVTRHEFQREFVDVNSALDMLVSNIFDSIREQQLTTTVVGGLLHSALLEPVAKALLLDESALLVTQVVDALVGFLTTPLIDALDEALLQNKVEVLTRLENTLKTNGGGADLLGLSNVLNPWAISPGADVTGYFVTEMDFDLQPVVASGQVARTWEDIPMSKQAGEELSVERYLTLILLDGANRIDKIDIKKEGLVGPLVDGVVDDAVLYGRLINIENDLSYEAQPNVAYHTNYAFLNLTLDNYGYSEEGDPLELTAQLDSALVTEELLSSLLGDLGGLIGGVLLRPLLNAVTGVLQETTFALNVYLPDLGIQNIVVEGGWEPVTSSVDGQ